MLCRYLEGRRRGGGLCARLRDPESRTTCSAAAKAEEGRYMVCVHVCVCTCVYTSVYAEGCIPLPISFPPFRPSPILSPSPLLPLRSPPSSPSLLPPSPFPLPPRFIVDRKWMMQWKRYVGYDQWDQYHAGQQSVNPGPIDNANLLKGTSIATYC